MCKRERPERTDSTFFLRKNIFRPIIDGGGPEEKVSNSAKFRDEQIVENFTEDFFQSLLHVVFTLDPNHRLFFVGSIMSSVKVDGYICTTMFVFLCFDF